MCDGHHHGGRYSLPTHVSDAEEQFPVPDEIIVKVTPNLLGRGQISLDGQVVLIQGGLREHLFLNTPGNPEFTPDTGLFHVRFPEPLPVPGEAVDDEDDEDQAGQGHQENPPHHRAYRSEHFIPVRHARDDPAGIPRQRLEVKIGSLSIHRVPELDETDPVMSTDRPDDRRVGHQASHIGHRLPGNPLLSGAGHQPPIVGEEKVERRGVIRIRVQGIAEPGQVDVQAADGGDPAAAVPDRISVGG